MASQQELALHREDCGEPSFRFRIQNRRPTTKLALIDASVAVAEEIERLHFECAGAPWFPKYNAERTAKNSTSSHPILPVAHAPRGRTRVQPPQPAPHINSALAAINKAMTMSQQTPIGDHNFVQAPISAPNTSHTCSVLADIATLQETVKRHDLRFTGLEQGMSKGFENMIEKWLNSCGIFVARLLLHLVVAILVAI